MPPYKEMELNTVKAVVKDILTTEKVTRGNDDLLYSYVVEKYGVSVFTDTLGNFLRTRRYRGIPSFEAVRRARQKVQAENKELRPADNIINGRNISKADYYGFAKE